MRYQLRNGLTVVLEPQHAAPVVALQVWVKAGSADEAPHEAGLAHLHEHMLFKGTARRGLGEIARAVEARGGEINAWTSFDQTVYHVVLASAFFAEGLDILSDAVRNSAFDPGELAREIEVVVEEIKRSADLPSRRLSRAMFETAFQRHPYRLPVLGSEESVRSFTREKVLAFFARHYTPENMVVVVVGDVEEVHARAEIERALGGSWGRPYGALPPRATEPPQTEPRFALSREPVKEAHLALALPIPGIASPDLAALDLLAVMLGQGEGSRLNLGLRIEQALASDVYAYAYTPKDPGLLVAGATLPPETVGPALRAAVAELRRLQLQPLSPGDLEVAKAIIEADAVYGRETVQGVARKLGFYEAVAGGLDFEAKYYERVARLTADDVLDAARRHFVPQHLTVTGLFPHETPITDAQIRALVEEAFAETPPARPGRTRSPEERPPSKARARAPRQAASITPPRPPQTSRAPRRAMARPTASAVAARRSSQAPAPTTAMHVVGPRTAAPTPCPSRRRTVPPCRRRVR